MIAMTLVGSAVIFAGVISSVLAGASTSLLLAFILPVSLGGPASTIPDRLAGWGIASSLSLVAITPLWPAPVQVPLRQAAIAACRAIAQRLRADTREESELRRRARRDRRTGNCRCRRGGASVHRISLPSHRVEHRLACTRPARRRAALDHGHHRPTHSQRAGQTRRAADAEAEPDGGRRPLTGSRSSRRHSRTARSPAERRPGFARRDGASLREKSRKTCRALTATPTVI